MSDTYSQIYIQIIFAVKGRENLISSQWREELHKYIAGIIRNKNQKSIIVGGTSDHIHAFFGMKPSMLLSDLARDIKNNSSRFVKDQRMVRGHFSWQEGFGAFSYSSSDISSIYNYILNQDKHHQKRNFKVEFLQLLKENEIAYEDKYLFEWYE